MQWLEELLIAGAESSRTFSATRRRGYFGVLGHASSEKLCVAHRHAAAQSKTRGDPVGIRKTFTLSHWHRMARGARVLDLCVPS